jgi:hypothetical protein
MQIAFPVTRLRDTGPYMRESRERLGPPSPSSQILRIRRERTNMTAWNQDRSGIKSHSVTGNCSYSLHHCPFVDWVDTGNNVVLSERRRIRSENNKGKERNCWIHGWTSRGSDTKMQPPIHKISATCNADRNWFSLLFTNL